ncbi:MAG TPA: glucuronate isomerase, partial [Candidatus Binatia bacterium]|nr:glucuronate isomerase [Candidatus Binatia bacterium]
GCWWFLNNPSIVEEMTRERIELLGASFIPQHSDARVLEQLIYKWRFSRRVISGALSNSYNLMAADGRCATPGEMERDVRLLLRDNFERWTKGESL